MRYEQGKSFTRHVDLQRILKFFLKSEERTVNRTFSDVQILSLYFRVDKDYRGDRVVVRYDPFDAELNSVLIYSLDGEYLGTGTRHEREGREEDTRPAPPSSPPKVKHNYLDLLIRKQQQNIERRSSGIDYREVLAAADRRWPFAEFAKQLAANLGRSGGLSAFRADELEENLMFLSHFKFTSQPFAERTSADALWPDERMQQGLARLRYVAEHGTVGLVTGASGVGKSALLKRFLHELSGPGWQPVYLHLTHLPAAGLLKLLVSKLDEVPRRGKDRLFEQILEKARQAEGTLLVILDEAHLLNIDALTDIRLLISSAIDDTPPLKVVLAGQEPLRHTLRQSSQAALLSRIGVRHHLSSLSKAQTAAYIDFQLKQAGGSEKLFEDSTKDMIHDYSGGVPRQINNLATACLLAAAAENGSRVTDAILQKTLTEFQLP